MKKTIEVTEVSKLVSDEFTDWATKTSESKPEIFYMEKHNCDNQSFPDIFIKCKHCGALNNLADIMSGKHNNECIWDRIDEGMMGFTDYMWQTSCGANYDCKQIERPKYCPNCGKLVVNGSKNK